MNHLLDQWQEGPAPAGLWEDVMAGVAEINQAAASQSPVKRPSGRPSVYMLRDLVAAAAVALVFIWNTGPWLGGGQMMAAGKTISTISTAYIQAADTALERAAGTAGLYSDKIFNEEWKQK